GVCHRQPAETHFVIEVPGDALVAEGELVGYSGDVGASRGYVVSTGDGGDGAGNARVANVRREEQIGRRSERDLRMGGAGCYSGRSLQSACRLIATHQPNQ